MLFEELTAEFGGVDDDRVDPTETYARYVLPLGHAKNPPEVGLVAEHSEEASDDGPWGWAWREDAFLGIIADE